MVAVIAGSVLLAQHNISWACLIAGIPVLTKGRGIELSAVLTDR